MADKNILDIINSAILEKLSNVHTILISKISKINTNTIDCLPVINRVLSDGEEIQLPEFKEVPLITLQGNATNYVHMPVSVGDYALIFVNERCFDNWYRDQDFIKPLKQRIFDYSDSFAIIGINPLSKAITIPTDSRTWLIGNTYQAGDWEHLGDLSEIGNTNKTGDYDLIGNMDIKGDLSVDGNITCTGRITATIDVVGGGVSLKNHMHIGNLGSPTSPPTP